ncbi:exodeoxyribonuclease III [Corynebacterium suicordis]
MSSFTVATVNVNGIRAAAKERSENNRGILPWLENTGVDVVLMQEVRADEKQTRQALEPALAAGWHLAQAPAEAKGRAGVGILSRTELKDVTVGFGHGEGEKGEEIPAAREFDGSGRYVEAVVASGIKDLGDVTVGSLYLPSGSARTAKQDEKYRFLDAFAPFMHARAEAGRPTIIGGDWNICHRRADLKNWRTNRTKSGFLPAERAFLDHVLGVWPDEATQVGDAEDSGRNGNPAGGESDFYGAVDYTPGELAQARLAAGAATDPQWFDVMRRLDPESTDVFSWWTFRGQAFDTNAGWRIDLQVATEDVLKHARSAWVDKAEAFDLRWSDHSPVIVEYN